MNTEAEQLKLSIEAKQLYDAILQGEHVNKVQIYFQANVLNKYREQQTFKIIRTNSSGRLNKQGGWHIDFGISGAHDEIIHTSIDNIVQRLPQSEHQHWLKALLTFPTSNNYVKGLLKPGCLDDGEMRIW